MSDTPNPYPNEGCSDEPPRARQKFQPIPAHEFATLDSARWIIKQVVPEGELIVIFGPSGCGKTFLTLDLLMAIAQGRDWFGHKANPGRVVYVGAESAFGVKKRLVAYAKRHALDLSTIPFDIIPDCPNLLNNIDGQLMGAMIGPAKVVVIDTLSRVMPGGDEKEGKDMGRAIAECQKIHQATGALIVLVHHTGKNVDQGARGWSGLKGACDTEISVEATHEGHAATITKQKDGETGARFGFTLPQIELGIDEDGEPITSCVLEPMLEPPAKKEKEGGGGKWQRFAWQAFTELYVPTTGPFVNIDQLITKTAEMALPPDDGKHDRRRESAKRAVEDLIYYGELDRNGNLVTKG